MITWPMHAQSALEALQTPALLMFLHCLPGAGLLALLHRWSDSSVDVSPLNLRTLKGSLPSVAFHSLQVRHTASVTALNNPSCQIVPS